MGRREAFEKGSCFWSRVNEDDERGMMRGEDERGRREGERAHRARKSSMMINTGRLRLSIRNSLSPIMCCRASALQYPAEWF